MKYALLLCLIPQLIFSKTLIFTTAFNRPDFIEWQHKLFNKFMLDDYEYIVFNDASTQKDHVSIHATCRYLKIRCIDIPQSIHTQPYLSRQIHDNLQQPNIRNCNAVQWAWDNYILKHKGPVLLIDSDMFLIRPLSLEKALEGSDLAYVSWSTTDMFNGNPYRYMWIALIGFNMNTLPSPEEICFNCGYLPNTNAVVDSGGWTSIYLRKFQNELKTKDISFLQGHTFFCPYRYGPPNQQINASPLEIRENLAQRGFTNQEIEMVLQKPDTIELLFDNHFLHYRCGTNYEGYSHKYLNSKDEILISFFEEILK